MKNIQINLTPSPRVERVGVRAAFTLVELIVVIVILAILATIAFLSFNNYSTSARDSDRLADTANISKGLAVLYSSAGSYPIPDNFITITAGTGYTMYQGIAGPKTLSIIKASDAKDNLDSTYYSYSTDLSRTHYSVGGYLENAPVSYSNSISNNINQVNAIDYSKRYLIIKGDSVGILTESGSNGISPIEQTTTAGTTIDLLNTSKNLILNTSKTNSISGTGLIVGIIQSNQNGKYSYSSPSSCPSGFIPVPGNYEFNQPGFCVMKYEAKTLSTSFGPSANGIAFHTHDYNTGETIVSTAPNIPIATITQPQAITACQSMGSGYHLITNNERMTIARDIESQSSNWSSNIVGTGYLYSGHNDNAPAYILTGSTDDSDGYNQTGDNPTSPGDNLWGSNFPSNIEQAYKGQRRTLYLSNGQIIWDVAGNVWEHVNKMSTIDGSNYNDGNNWKADACNGVNNYNSFYGNDGFTSCTYTNGYSYNNTGPKNPNLNANNGVGRLFSYNITNNIFVRGVGFMGGLYTGIYTLRLGWNLSSYDHMTGFRCVK